MTNPIQAIQKYYEETIEQLRKCVWPSGKELYELTLVIVSALVLSAVFVTACDYLCGFLVSFITGGFQG